MTTAKTDEQPTSTQPGRVPHTRVLLVASAGAFLAFLDATIVNVAFPSIRASFEGTSLSDLSWVLNAYNIVFAAFLVVFGRLSDLLGRRRTFTAGIALFTVASVACGLAPSVEFLIAARVVQALGAALLVPASLALVVQAFPEDKRSHGIGLWGATAAIAAGLGPPLGGALVEFGGWRWAFLVNLPVGVLAIVAAKRNLVESRAPGQRRLPDLRGAVLLAGALGVVNLAIIKGNDWGWASLATLAAFVAGALLVAGFVLSSRRHRVPLLDPTLLRLPSFAVANVATVLAGLGFFAYLLTNILWLQYVWDYTVLEAGLALMPAAIVAAVVASRLSAVAERHGYRVVVVPGAIVWALAYVWYHQRAGVEPAFLTQWLPGQILSGIGVGATLPILASAAMAAVPGGRYATASAVVSSARQLGGVVGISLLVVIIGTPTPQTVVGLLRDGWVLSIAVFVAVAVVALALPRVESAPVEEAEDDDVTAQVSLPPRVIAIEPAADALARVPLFAALPAPVRQRLEAVADRVRVPAGEVLIREGEEASSVYVLVTGRLEVLVGDRLVRELRPGAVLGELAVLTGERRSATVRARRDATLLQVSARDFDALIATDPDAGRVVVTQLAERLRNPAPAAAERPAGADVVGVVALHPGAAVREVVEALTTRLSVHRRTVVLDVVSPEAVETAERDKVLALLAADVPDSEAASFAVRQADRVVLVADATASPGAAPTGLPPRTDLVLVGQRPAESVLAEWAACLSPARITVADGDLRLSLRRVADRLAGRSLGLVLGGGGARALAHVGVLREFEDAGIAVDRVAGASLGAIVGALYSDGDAEQLDALVYEEFVRRPSPFGDYGIPTASLAKGLRKRSRLQHRLGRDTLIEALPRLFACVTTDLVTRQRHVHDSGPLCVAVDASSALPVLLPPVRDGQRLLVDGGILDNLPVDVLTSTGEGPVVAVNISMGGPSRPRSAASTPRPPRIPALGETLLRTMMIGSGGAIAVAQAQGALVVTPATRGVGLLEFHQMDRMVEAGRQAARALLDATEGDLVGWASAPALPVPGQRPAVEIAPAR